MMDKVTGILALAAGLGMMVGGLAILVALEFDIIKHDKIKMTEKMREMLEEK